MDIRNMRQLLAVRTHGSLAKAAQALGMSQPSLSAAIARLEDQLKVKLFERSAHGSQLTPIGELIAERAVKVVAEAEQIVRDAALIAGGEAGSICIGVGTALKHNFLPRFVQAVADTFPGLSLSFELLDRDRLVPLVRSRHVDVGICAVADDLVDDALVVTEVLTTRAIAAARPDHPLVGEPSVSLARGAQFAAAGTSLRRYTNISMFDGLGEPDRLLKYRANDYDPLIDLALAGHCMLIGPAFVLQPYLQDGRLARIDLQLDYRVSFAAVATRAASYSPIVSRVVRHAAAIGAALQAEAEAL